MADLYQPPSYQRPLKGVVTAIGNERNPITRVGITRRGVEIELNAYAETNPDDDAGVAVKVGDGVLIEKDSSGTWRIRQRIDAKLADPTGRFSVGTYRTGNTGFVTLTAIGGDTDAIPSAYVSVAANPEQALMLARVQSGGDDARILLDGGTAGMSVTGGGELSLTDTTAAIGMQNGMQAVISPAGVSVGAGHAGIVATGTPVSVLAAPAAGLPASIRMDVQGQAPNQYVTLPVAQLAQAVSELQVTPGVTYGPPAPEPGITNLTVVSRYTASTPTRFQELVISWDDGPQTGVCYRQKVSFAAGVGHAQPTEVLQTQNRQIISEQFATRGFGLRNLSFPPLLELSKPNYFPWFGGGNRRVQLLALVDYPLNANPANLQRLPASVTMQLRTITRGEITISPNRTDIWRRYELVLYTPAPLATAAPRQVVFADLELADGYQFAE